ncbi:MAG: helix-turn-helix domain-containing protein [Janthinobacterium lividum]
MTASAGRGRPRGGRTDARERLLAEARRQFTERGYERTTLRGVAQVCGLDAALISYHSGSKRQLFAAAVDVPAGPADVVEAAVRNGTVDAERLLHGVTGGWEDPRTGPPLRSLGPGRAPSRRTTSGHAGVPRARARRRAGGQADRAAPRTSCASRGLRRLSRKHETSLPATADLPWPARVFHVNVKVRGLLGPRTDPEGRTSVTEPNRREPTARGTPPLRPAPAAVRRPPTPRPAARRSGCPSGAARRRSRGRPRR